MENFEFNVPTHVYFGKGQVKALHDLCAPYDVVLVVYGGGSVKRNGSYDAVMKQLKGKKFVELAGVAPNPRVDEVRRGIELVRSEGVQAIVTIGGGSVLDSGKAIALGAFSDLDAWDMIVSGKYPDKALPVFAVATMAASGSELGNGAVISNVDTHEKRSLGTPLCFPKAAVLDPDYTLSVPKHQTAAGAVDILAHLIESYFVRRTTDLQDGMQEAVMRTVVARARAAYQGPDDYESRAELLWASELANSGMLCLGFGFQPWANHTIGAELSARYDTTHGDSLSILIPHWMRYALAKDPSVAPRFARFARNVFGVDEADDVAAAKAGIVALEAFYTSLGLPLSLDFTKGDIPAMAKDAVEQGYLGQSYVPLDQADVEKILEACRR